MIRKVISEIESLKISLFICRHLVVMVAQFYFVYLEHEDKSFRIIVYFVI